MPDLSKHKKALERKTVGCELYVQASAELDEEIQAELTLEDSEAVIQATKAAIKEAQNEVDTGCDGASDSD